MDDQRLAGEDLQRRRRIEIVSGGLPVGRRAADELIGEDQHVLHGLRHGIENGGALLRDQPHLEHAVFAGKRHRLSERGPHRWIEFGARFLRFGGDTVPCRHEDESRRDRTHEHAQHSCSHPSRGRTLAHEFLRTGAGCEPTHHRLHAQLPVDLARASTRLRHCRLEPAAGRAGT
jgi:hypothetical protein